MDFGESFGGFGWNQGPRNWNTEKLKSREAVEAELGPARRPLL